MGADRDANGGHDDRSVSIGDHGACLIIDRPAILGTSVRVTLAVGGMTATHRIELATRHDLAAFFAGLMEGGRAWDEAQGFVSTDGDLSLECWHGHEGAIHMWVTVGDPLADDPQEHEGWQARGWITLPVEGLGQLPGALRDLMSPPTQRSAG